MNQKQWTGQRRNISVNINIRILGLVYTCDRTININVLFIVNVKKEIDRVIFMI